MIKIKSIILFLFVSLSITQEHFILDIEETGESTLFLFENSITTLGIGDEIGVFANNLLVGAGVWDGEDLPIVGIHEVDLSDFGKELAMLKELRTGSCVGIVSISAGILRAAEVILHSMRGNELLVMTANPDVGSRLLALLRAANYVLCDSPSLPLVEHTLRQNRSQLIRMPQVHCAEKYLGESTLERLQKEIGLLK